MKKMIVTMFAALIGTASLLAQEPPLSDPPKKSPQERAEQMTKRITKELGLTADQQVKVKEIVLKRELKRDENMKKRKEEMEKVEAELKTIFTAEQYKKFTEKKEEIKKKRQERRPPPPKDAPVPEGK